MHVNETQSTYVKKPDNYKKAQFNYLNDCVCKLGSITAVATHFEVAKNPIDMHYFACPKFSYVNLGIFLCTQKNFIQKSSTNHE